MESSSTCGWITRPIELAQQMVGPLAQVLVDLAEHRRISMAQQCSNGHGIDTRD